MSITIVTGPPKTGKTEHVNKLRQEGAIATHDLATAFALSRAGHDVVLDDPFPGQTVKLVTMKPKADEPVKKTATKK